MSSLQQNIKYHFILFFISPVLGLLYGLKSKSLAYMRWSIFGFVVIYGSLFSRFQLGDGAVHWDNVYNHYQYLDFSVFWSELLDIMSLDHSREVNDDPYIHILSYFVGTVLNAPGLFFVFVGAVYGYFYSGVAVKIIGYINWKSKYNKFYFIFFLAILVLWIFPLKMQTVRSWTGMWVLLYAILSYHETRKKKYWLLALVPPLFHIGFLALAFPIWFVLFSGYRNFKVYFIIFISSIFFSNALRQTSFSSLASQTKVGKSKVDSYMLDEARQQLKRNNIVINKSGSNFYRRSQNLNIQKSVVSGIIIFIFIFLRKKGFGEIEKTLFSYGLAMASFANFFTSVYAVHNRGWPIASILILSSLVIFLSKNNLNSIGFSLFKIKLPLFIFTIGLIPFGLFLISNALSYTSPFAFFLPVFSWMDSEMATNIRAVLGLFL